MCTETGLAVSCAILWWHDLLLSCIWMLEPSLPCKPVDGGIGSFTVFGITLSELVAAT